MSKKKLKGKKKAAAPEAAVAVEAPKKKASAKPAAAVKSEPVAKPEPTGAHEAASLKAAASKTTVAASAAGDANIDAALDLLGGRWKLVLLHRLSGGKVLRFSDLERAVPGITQKMLGQQLKQLEADGLVVRKAYPQVPPRVEYSLTAWGQALSPSLDAILTWASHRPA